MEAKQENDMTSDMLFAALKRTRDMFVGNVGAKVEEDPELVDYVRKFKVMSEYAPFVDKHLVISDRQRNKILRRLGVEGAQEREEKAAIEIGKKPVEASPSKKGTTASLPPSAAVVPGPAPDTTSAKPISAPEESKRKSVETKRSDLSLASILTSAEHAVAIRPRKELKPQWHRPWKLMRVISGHQGWVRCLAVDPLNQFFVSGSNDRTIKFWDLATGQLRITLTGHISTVRGLAVSARHPYLFSCGEDKNVFCWDLEQNKVVRKYHGHLSGVYSVALHPTLDVLVTGGRDSTARVWDMRTKSCITVLQGHSDTVGALIAQEFEPQIITGSHDTMVKLWDIGTGKCVQTLTQHKKGIRAMVAHHEEYTFASAGADKVRVWKCPEGQPLRNIAGHNAIINAMALNTDNVLVTAADNGSMYFWDWATGYNFQQLKTTPQPGSLSCEAGIYAATFDRSSLRLITAECDKTIKFWKEDETATPETFPIQVSRLGKVEKE